MVVMASWASLLCLGASAGSPQLISSEVDAVEGSVQAADAAAEDSAHADPECDRLFGTQEAREDNRQAREGRLVLVEDGPSYIDVVQTGGWSEPTEIAYRGLELRETTTGEDGQPLAVMEVDASLGFCEPGEYEVEVDDSLGDQGRILAILPGLMVVEHGDRLRYVRSETYRGRPAFKVSWRSPFSVVVESKSSGSSRSKRSARRRRRRRR